MKTIIITTAAAVVIAAGGAVLTASAQLPPDFTGASAGAGPVGDLNFDRKPARRAPIANGPPWRIGMAGALVEDPKAGVALTVGCVGPIGRVLSFDIAGRPASVSADAIGEVQGAFDRLIGGLRSAAVTVYGPSGETLIVVRRTRDGYGNVGLWKTLSPAELSAIKASTSITVVTDRWRAVFAGAGATRAINGLSCDA